VVLLEYRKLHDWPTTKAEAHAIQEEMAGWVELHTIIETPELIAAVDTAYGSNNETLFASAVVTTFPEIEVVERTNHYGPLNFPYIPGLFYFREGPIIIEALAKVSSNPDLVIVHGHGLAHPKRCGMACSIGIAFDKPTIGCARKLLTGYHRPVGEAKGSYQPITIGSKKVGFAYRSRDNVKPIFISPAYKCDPDQAKEIIVQNLRGYRLPEPLRLAHLFANKFRRQIEKKRTREEKVK
jgi:deoxyribonuclease V